MKKKIFIFGLGYTASFLSKKLIPLGYEVVGTTRQKTERARFNSNQITLVHFESPKIQEYFSQSSAVLISTPPLASGEDPVLLQYADLIKDNAANIKWLGYLSSTGIYGDHQGKWVTENSLCQPRSASGIARLNAEKAWLALAKENQLPLNIFRLAGIYGPERNALERVISGKRYSVFKAGQVFSRIHVDDIVSALIASMLAVESLAIYNLADDEPAPSHVVDQYAASLLQRPPLPLVSSTEATLSGLERAFYLSNRRVSNLRMKQKLHLVLQYPSFRQGLKKIWEDDFKSIQN